MAYRRVERVTQVVHRELDQMIRLELKDPALKPVSITHVRMTRDLRRAHVVVTPLGGEGDGLGTLAALRRAAGWMRGELGRRLRLRHAPEILFALDETLDEAVAMTALLDRLARERTMAEAEE